MVTEGYQGVLAGRDPWSKLDLERRTMAVLRQAMRAADTSKVQLVGISELTPPMSTLERSAKEGNRSLAGLLLGSKKYLYYDSPKMVEAIIRLARGHKDPSEVILRFDADVSPNQKGIKRLVTYLDSLPTEMRKGYFLFSGGYRHHNPVDLLNDFAVRTHHFAPLETKRFTRIDAESMGCEDRYDMAEKWIEEMKQIGADPCNQVISGAGLCMSHEAISTLPPFANMEEQIVWIDDYLKRALHEDLRHLPSSNECKEDELYRCCSKANFKQDRHPRGIGEGDLKWASDTYLPRLVYGCIMDSIIREEKPDEEKNRLSYYSDIIDKWQRDSIAMPKPEQLAKKLRPRAGQRVKLIKKIWRQNCYRDYPVGKFAREKLETGGGEYIDKAIRNLNLYLNLIKIWPGFVILIQKLRASDKDNAWLFRGLDL